MSHICCTFRKVDACNQGTFIGHTAHGISATGSSANRCRWDWPITTTNIARREAFVYWPSRISNQSTQVGRSMDPWPCNSTLRRCTSQASSHRKSLHPRTRLLQSLLQADSTAHRRVASVYDHDRQHATHSVSNWRRGRELSHQSFLNINSLLSAIFTHARRSGTLQGPNPTDGVEIPEGKRTRKTAKYTLEEVEKITEAVDGLARCAVVLAAWTGLSLAELRGLKWVDIDFENKRLNVVRTVWHREILDTKTEHRAAAVPLLANVIAELKRYREQNPGTARLGSSKVLGSFRWTWQPSVRSTSRRHCNPRALSGRASILSAEDWGRGCTTAASN